MALLATKAGATIFDYSSPGQDGRIGQRWQICVIDGIIYGANF